VTGGFRRGRRGCPPSRWRPGAIRSLGDSGAGCQRVVRGRRGLCRTTFLPRVWGGADPAVPKWSRPILGGFVCAGGGGPPRGRGGKMGAAARPGKLASERFRRFRRKGAGRKGRWFSSLQRDDGESGQGQGPPTIEGPRGDEGQWGSAGSRPLPHHSRAVVRTPGGVRHAPSGQRVYDKGHRPAPCRASIHSGGSRGGGCYRGGLSGLACGASRRIITGWAASVRLKRCPQVDLRPKGWRALPR